MAQPENIGEQIGAMPTGPQALPIDGQAEQQMVDDLAKQLQAALEGSLNQ